MTMEQPFVWGEDPNNLRVYTREMIRWGSWLGEMMGWGVLQVICWGVGVIEVEVEAPSIKDNLKKARTWQKMLAPGPGRSGPLMNATANLSPDWVCKPHLCNTIPHKWCQKKHCLLSLCTPSCPCAHMHHMHGCITSCLFGCATGSSYLSKDHWQMTGQDSSKWMKLGPTFYLSSRVAWKGKARCYGHFFLQTLHLLPDNTLYMVCTFMYWVCTFMHSLVKRTFL